MYEFEGIRSGEGGRWNILVSFKTRYSAEQVRYFINVYE
jgi:hypothetical protein